MAATVSLVHADSIATLAFYKCKVLFDAAATVTVNTGFQEILFYGVTNIDDTIVHQTSVSGSQITSDGTNTKYVYIWAVGVA